MTWTFQWINWIKGKLGKFSFVDTYSLKKLLILLSPANAGISPRRYLNFHHLFAIWWARLTLVWFSPLFTPFSLCLHFTFLSLTVALGTLFKILLFASVFIHRAETSGLIKRITLLSWNLKIFFLNLRHSKIDFLQLKLGVISTPKTAHNQGENNESQTLYYKSYFARHFYAVLKPWATGKCMCNIKSIGLVLLPWRLLKFAASSRIRKLNFSKFLKM